MVDEGRKKFLLLLSTTRRSPESIRLALDKAEEEHGELVALFVLDDKLSESVAEQLTQEGWIGGKPSDALRKAILKEYYIQGRQKLEDLEAEAQKRGIPYRAIFARGDFAEEALKVIQQEKAEEVIVTRRRRSNFSRFLFGSPVAELKEKLGERLVIVDEE